MLTVHANDFFTLTERRITADGYLVAPGVLARTGVQLYRAFELGLDKEMGMDPMKVIRLHRPAEEVFNEDSMRSFEGVPVTVEHPPEAVTAANWKEYSVGDAHSICRSGENMGGHVVVRDADAIQAVQEGKVELSNGYTFSLDLTPGVALNGEAYDGVQRNIRGNHVALVDKARCGSACRIADSQPQEKEKMADRKMVIDGIPVEVNDTAAAAIDKLMKAHEDATKRAADAEAKVTQIKVGDQTMSLDALVKLAVDQAAQIETLKKDVMTPEARDAMVADWVKLLGDAKALVPELVTDGKTCVQIRREAIAAVTGKDSTAKAIAAAVLAGKTVEAADADALRAAFNAIVAAAPKGEAEAKGTQAMDSQVAAALSGADAAKVQTPVLTGRDAFLARSQQAWQKPQS